VTPGNRLVEEVSMFVIDHAADPVVHRACSRIANRVVFFIRPLLRDGEARDFALREAYAIAREEIKRHKSPAAPGELARDDRPQVPETGQRRA